MNTAFRYPDIDSLYADCPEMPAKGDPAILARSVKGDGFSLKNAISNVNYQIIEEDYQQWLMIF